MVTTYKPTIDEVKDGIEWSALEWALLNACETGDAAVLLGKSDLPSDTSDPDRRVRASLIRYLLLGGCQTKENGRRPHQKGIQLRGAWIDGALDCEGCHSSLSIQLYACLFSASVNFEDAKIGGLYLSESRVEIGLNLHRLETRHGISLRDGFCSNGLVDLVGAHIGGKLDCRNALLNCDDDTALNANGATFKASVFLNDGFQANGLVKFTDAKIGGNLSCTNGCFSGVAEGVLDDDGTHITVHQTALNCFGISVASDVCLDKGFRSNGLVNFGRAKIRGRLDCENSRFNGDTAKSLDCNGASIGTDVFLRSGFKAKGLVDLGGANIGGQLSCKGGKFKGSGGEALNCNRAKIGNDVLLREYFEASGLVDFGGAQIGGQLECSKCKFIAHDEEALNCHRATIKSSLQLCEGFEATGLVDLYGVRIGAGLIVSQARIQGELRLRDAQAGILIDDKDVWYTIDRFDITNFRYNRINAVHSARGRLSWLNRSEQAHLKPTPYGGGRLATQFSDFNPQPYVHLAGMLYANGHKRWAARVNVAMEDRIRKAEFYRAIGLATIDDNPELRRISAWVRRGVGWFFRALFGYGHQPARALGWVFAIWLGAVLLYSQVYASGQMAPNSDVVLTSSAWLDAVAQGCAPMDWSAVGWRFDAPINQNCEMPLHLWLAASQSEVPHASADYETFHAGLYALDLFIPLDALGQENAWAPSRERGWWGWLGYAMRMPIQMAGWIITAVGAAVLTGLVGRKD